MFLHSLSILSPTLKILVIFCLTLVASRLRLPLGLALAAGGILLDLWAGRTPALVSADIAATLAAPSLWLMLLDVTLILEFGYFMAARPNARAIIAAARRLGGRHGLSLSLVLVPAAIGLVPMPGGALFSAPLVGESVHGRSLPQAWQAMVNYWFRHVIEYWWPLYPVIIVSFSIFSLPSWKFFALQMPFSAVAILAGWYFILRPRRELLHDDRPDQTPPASRLGPVLTPILIVVASAILLPLPLTTLLPTFAPATVKLLAMLAGLVVGLALLAWQSHSTLSARPREVADDEAMPRLFANLFGAKTLEVIVTLGGVMVFQDLLKRSGLLPLAGAELASAHVPLEAIIAFLPFLAGLVTGIAIGFGGTAFPLVLGLATPETGISQAAVLVLAFSAGYAGMMLSPIHLCYILTLRFFCVRLPDTLRYIVPCVTSVLLFGILMHLLVRLAGW
ncbi:MAG: hypothetical protein BWK76_15175 [Desulfobulbaceae bacterium A2]|nr:MAG: hypothetical protein BWK76_15175 [Desulfobulbaceae bacterium A2]